MRLNALPAECTSALTKVILGDSLSLAMDIRWRVIEILTLLEGTAEFYYAAACEDQISKGPA